MNDAVEVHDVEEPRTRRGDVLSVLRATDDDFHPPLSRRGASDGFHGEGGLEAYVDTVLDDGLLVAETGGEVAGVMVYRTGHTAEYIDGPASYVETVAVHPARRGEGTGRALYRKLLDEAGSDAVATRTWGTNEAHLALLEKLGFREASREPDDRPGGVDTVYLVLDR